jgi:hypothetical protein
MSGEPREVLDHPSQIVCACGHIAGEHGAVCFECDCDLTIETVMRLGYRAALAAALQRAEEAEKRLEAAERHGMERAAGMVPTTWLDPLLTGPEAVVGWTAHGDIQRILLAVRDRIMAAARAEEET